MPINRKFSDMRVPPKQDPPPYDGYTYKADPKAKYELMKVDLPEGYPLDSIWGYSVLRSIRFSIPPFIPDYVDMDYYKSNLQLVNKFESTESARVGSCVDRHPLHTGIGYEHSEQSEVPDCVMPLTGYRMWTVDKIRPHLNSVTFSVFHLDPAVAAGSVCAYNDAEHTSPQDSCDCGWYSFKSLESLMSNYRMTNMSDWVIGIVDLWGKVIEHEHGYRAQYMYPRELWLTNPEQEYLGEMYGVPVRKAY